MSRTRKNISKRSSTPETLSLERLIDVASSSEKQPTSIWTSVAATFAQGPGLAKDLGNERDRVPSGPSPDPVVSALRRICWPSSRLAVRHRRALDQAGSAPVAFMRLVLEEARTTSWRSFHSIPLESVTRWVLQRPLPGLDRYAELNELGAIATSYLALITLRFGKEENFMPVLRRMAILERYLSREHPAADFGIALVEGMCTFGFLAAHQGDPASTRELFSRAEQFLVVPHTDGDAGETQAFFHICRAWSEGLLTDEEWRVETIYSEALAVLKPNSDPWLPLFIHHEAAKSAITFACARMPNPEEIQQHIRMDLPLQERRQDFFAWIQKHYFDHGSAERDATLRALAHLEAAEPLFAEFQTDEVAIQHLWLWSHALIHTDPIRGVDMILEAYRRALQLEDFNRATTMALDTLYLICQLSRSTEPRERVQACIDRAVGVLVEPEVLRRDKPDWEPLKQQIVMPLSLLSRIGGGSARG